MTVDQQSLKNLVNLDKCPSLIEKYQGIAALPFDLPRFEPDSWTDFWEIWNSENQKVWRQHIDRGAVGAAGSAAPAPALPDERGRRSGDDVVGRGPALPIAMETALKLKETCAIHAEAYSVAEVMHPATLDARRDSVEVLVSGPSKRARNGCFWKRWVIR